MKLCLRIAAARRANIFYKFNQCCVVNDTGGFMENAPNFSRNFRNIEYQWILNTICPCRSFSVWCYGRRSSSSTWHGWSSGVEHSRVFRSLQEKLPIHRIARIPSSSYAMWTQPQIPYLKNSFQNYDLHVDVVVSTTEKNNFVPARTKSASYLRTNDRHGKQSETDKTNKATNSYIIITHNLYSIIHDRQAATNESHAICTTVCSVHHWNCIFRIFTCLLCSIQDA